MRCSTIQLVVSQQVGSGDPFISVIPVDIWILHLTINPLLTFLLPCSFHPPYWPLHVAPAFDFVVREVTPVVECKWLPLFFFLCKMKPTGVPHCLVWLDLTMSSLKPVALWQWRQHLPQKRSQSGMEGEVLRMCVPVWRAFWMNWKALCQLQCE